MQGVINLEHLVMPNGIVKKAYQHSETKHFSAVEAYNHAADTVYGNVYHNGDARNYLAADKIVYDEILASYIGQEDKILEIGPGIGDTIKHLGNKISPKNYTAYDPSPRMSAKAKELYPEYSFFSIKVQNAGLLDDYFDVAISIFAPPSYDAEGYSGAVFAALRSGGMYISGPYTHLMALGPRLQPNMIDTYPHVSRKFFLESQDAYRNELKSSGFCVLDEIGIDYSTHQQVYLDANRGMLRTVDEYYKHMKYFDALARDMGIRATDFRHAIYIAQKPHE